jgi:hypothetical protein
MLSKLTVAFLINHIETKTILSLANPKCRKSNQNQNKEMECSGIITANINIKKIPGNN